MMFVAIVWCHATTTKCVFDYRGARQHAALRRLCTHRQWHSTRCVWLIRCDCRCSYCVARHTEIIAKIARDVSNGMASLHKADVAHGSLALVLFCIDCGNGDVCVTDNLYLGVHSAWFAWVGQSSGRWVCSGEAGQLFRRIDTQRRRMYAKQLNYTTILTNTCLLYTVACPWLANLAPELLDPDTDMWTTAIDVYAFGVILWELFTWVAFSPHIMTFALLSNGVHFIYLFACVVDDERMLVWQRKPLLMVCWITNYDLQYHLIYLTFSLD